MKEVTELLGQTGVIPAGEYSASKTYDFLNLVYAAPSSYVSKKPNNVGHPVTDTEWWQLSLDGSQSEAAAEEARQAATAALEAAAAAAPTVVNVEGAEVTLNVEASHKYLCGELTSLTISSVENSTREATIWFRSGAVATQLIMPQALSDKAIGYAVPATNTDYEINIANGSPVIVHPR